MRHPPMWLVILFSPVVILAVIGIFRLLWPILAILPLHTAAKPLLGGAWALFLLIWCLLVHSCWAEGDPWAWVWKSMIWAIVGTMFVNQMCVWSSSHWKIADKDIDGVVAGTSLFYFISTLWITSRYQALLERKSKSNQTRNVKPR